MSDELWKKVTALIVNVGKIPFPIEENLIQFIRSKLTKEQAKFLFKFTHHSMSLEEIMAGSDISEIETLKMLEDLMDKGIIAGYPDKKTGSLKYTLMALYPGIIEYTFVKGERGEKEEKSATLIQNFVLELMDEIEKNYENFMPLIKEIPSSEQIIPVEETIPEGQEVILITENAFKFIDQCEDIAVVHCYCKEQEDLMKDPCKITNNRKICLNFGDTAKFVIEHKFGEPISKDEAKRILREAEDLGLVHKIFKSDLNLGRTIDGICSCCKCCCGFFRYYHKGGWPYQTITSYISKIDKNLCIGCEECINICPMENITMKNEIAHLDKKCIGCGLCAHKCQENAIELIRTGPRNVLIPPKNF